MPDEPSADGLAAWRAFLTAHARVTDTLARELEAERAMPLTWYDVLVQLSEAPGGRLRMHGLAQAVLLSRAGLTRLVDRMAAAGLVRREPCADDRRGVYVEMTGAGLAALRRASPVHLRGVAEHFVARLSGDELRTMRTAFERLVRTRSSAAGAPAETSDSRAGRPRPQAGQRTRRAGGHA